MEKNNRISTMPFGRTNNLVVQEVDDEMLVYDLKNNKAICLNPTAKFVWKSCNGKTSISDISKHIEKKFDTKNPEDILALSLTELKANNLLTDDQLPLNLEPNLSRRDLIVKYGVPLSALPMVMTLVAPVSAQMASCVAVGDACGTAADCCVANNRCEGLPQTCCLPTGVTCTVTPALPDGGCCSGVCNVQCAD